MAWYDGRYDNACCLYEKEFGENMCPNQIAKPLTTTQPTTQTEFPTLPAATCSLGSDYRNRPKGDVTVYAKHASGGNCDLNWNFYKSLNAVNANLGKTWIYFAALPKYTKYEKGANCGRCVKLKCSCDQTRFTGACQPSGKETIAMITDSCPSCPGIGDIDVSYAAWNTITGQEGFSRYDGAWEFVECPLSFVQDVARLRIKAGSSRWWYAVQPYNFRHKIEKVELKDDAGRWIQLELYVGNMEGFFFMDPNKKILSIAHGFDVRVTNSEGSVGSIHLNDESDLSSGKEHKLNNFL